MEETPLFPPSPEEDDEDEEDDSPESILKPKPKEKKKELSKEIVQSLIEPSKERPREEASTEQEEESFELTPEEEVDINRAIAEKHLEHPITPDTPEEPVNDYLERVIGGAEPEEAFDSTIEENSLEEDPTVTEVDNEVDQEPLPSNPPAEEAPADEYAFRPVTQPHPSDPMPPPSRPASGPSGGAGNPNSLPRAQQGPRQQEAPRAERSRAASFMTGELTGYILGKRSGKRQANEKNQAQQKKIERHVSRIEQNISSQELTIQQLSQEKRARERVTAPSERTQPGLRESRLNLTKPEQAGRLGKVVIEAERPAAPLRAAKLEAQPAKPLPRPEQVKTMPREDLLALSKKIKVEGASLGDMYENNLFGEGALRRLVAERLKGQDILPQLKREILEKQMDFERDPILRDRDHLGEQQDPALFEQMLAGANEAKPLSQGAEVKGPGHKASRSKDVAKQSVETPKKGLPKSANLTLLAVIALLIAAIIYLLLHG